jgi:hypothetical protein
LYFFSLQNCWTIGGKCPPDHDRLINPSKIAGFTDLGSRRWSRRPRIGRWGLRRGRRRFLSKGVRLLNVIFLKLRLVSLFNCDFFIVVNRIFGYVENYIVSWKLPLLSSYRENPWQLYLPVDWGCSGEKTLVHLFATWQCLNLSQTFLLIFLTLFSPLSRLLFNGRLKTMRVTLLVFLSEHNSTFVCVFLFCQSGMIMLIYVCECFLISLIPTSTGISYGYPIDISYDPVGYPSWMSYGCLQDVLMSSPMDVKRVYP